MLRHCCERMQAELDKNCSAHDRFQCPDSLIGYVPKFDEYGIIVHDGGSSIVQINFCPWCGTKLPDSKRDRWFDELEKMGVDPAGDSIPKEFQSEIWYRPGSK